MCEPHDCVANLETENIRLTQALEEIAVGEDPSFPGRGIKRPAPALRCIARTALRKP